jgi:cellulose synthase/poly-beta-1,6-N-acetylglucosamine synthase-like glycosyltransferase
MKHCKGPARETAHRFLSRGQAILMVVCLLALAAGLVLQRHATALTCVALAMLFYLLFVGLKIGTWAAAAFYKLPADDVLSSSDPDLPLYTLFVPLYREANMLPKLVDSISRLEYPKDKLQVLLLLEADDDETRAAALEVVLPDYFEVVVVPDCVPKGKPKALNMGLARAEGALCVIYDAEDRPEPDQLLKSVAAFRRAEPDVACVQARLVFWNQATNWVTRLYWAEYVTHFSWTLAGLTKLGLVVPLGGTSNHFRTAALRTVAIDPARLSSTATGVGGWDPWNVTEDAELAGALTMHGFRIQMMDSVTREEATAKRRIADRQRRRWLKGYLQTGLTYSRRPLRHVRQMGFTRWFCYCLLMLGTPVSLVLNPVFWTATIVYFCTRSTIIERLFPLPLYYTSLVLLIAGNMFLAYQLVIACLKEEGYGSVKYMLLSPFWWLFTSYSCYRMFFELISPKTRHVWHKTDHGHDLSKEESLDENKNRESSRAIDNLA